MHDSITTTQVRGNGRGKWLGFPTINLAIPDGVSLKEGVYAVRVTIASKQFQGAMHYGPVPVFKDERIHMEVFLIDTADEDITDK